MKPLSGGAARRASYPTLMLALMLALCLAGCVSNNAQSPDVRKDVIEVEQLQVQVTRNSFADIGAETGHGGYGEYTEIVLENEGYDALKAALDERNKLVATQLVDTVRNHANNPDAQTTTESHAMDVALGGVDNTVQAVDFIDFLTAGTVTRADSNLTCLLESTGTQLDGWGDKVSFASHVYDSQTGAELALDDLVTDTSQLPAIIDEALHEKYLVDGMFKEGEDAARVVRDKLENPAEHGALAWTADYLGMKFYFDSNDFSNANAYHGMYVSIPYAEHPGLFADVCTTTPDDFIAQLEYGMAYDLPGDVQGRSIRITRVHDDDAKAPGLLGTSPSSMSLNSGWTFCVQIGTGTGDKFEPTSEASNTPWFYDVYRQDYMPSLVRVNGAYYVYGFGDRNSEDYNTAVYALGDEVKSLGEIEEGFVAQPTYTHWSLPCNPAAVTMADTDCLASYDRITFERDCAIDGTTGMPSPEAESYRAHTVNQAYKMRMSVSGMLLDENGQEGEAAVVEEGAVCFLEAGMPQAHYDMKLDDGRLIRFIYDKSTRKIDDHYTADIMSMVPAASAAAAQIESGPRQRTVWQHGREVSLIPETGNIVGTGAIIDYGDTPWWIEEEFKGAWAMTEADCALIAEWYSDGNPPDDGKLVINEDGTLTMVFDGRTYEGSLDETRGYGVYATGHMAATDGGYSQSIWFDYTPESEADKSWAHIVFHADDLPYPLSEEVSAFQCYLTRQ